MSPSPVSDDAQPNPYQSPQSTDEASADPKGHPARHGWLVSLSLILAIMIEVLPTEVDVLVVAARKGDVMLYVLAKAVFLALILSPLSVYFILNGWRGANAARGRTLAVAIIVAMRLVFDACYLFSSYG